MSLVFPTNPSNGDEYQGYVYDSTANVWNRLPNNPEFVRFSETAPSNPQEGTLWYDTTVAKMYVYYNDGTSSQWVSAVGGVAGQEGTAGQMLIHDGNEWVADSLKNKNYIINGDFNISQRGDLFSLDNPGGSAYTADRWNVQYLSGSSFSVIQQNFNPGDMVVDGYGDAENFLAFQIANTTEAILEQRIEDVRTLAGQTVTLSFWAKRLYFDTNIQTRLVQNFGSGGSAEVITTGDTISLDSDVWSRFTTTFNVPSVSGKTIGSSSYLSVQFYGESLGESSNPSFFGVQLEKGSIASPFRLSGGGSKASELAECQRYYYKLINQGGGSVFGHIKTGSTTGAIFPGVFPQEMRSVPSVEQLFSPSIFIGTYNGSNAGVNAYIDNSQNSRQRYTVFYEHGTNFNSTALGTILKFNENTDIFGFDAEL